MVVCMALNPAAPSPATISKTTDIGYHGDRANNNTLTICRVKPKQKMRPWYLTTAKEAMTLADNNEPIAGAEINMPVKPAPTPKWSRATTG